MVSAGIDICHASLKRNYPALTREEVGELIDLENLSDVFLAVMDISGLRRKAMDAPAQAGAPEPGEAMPG
jgi:hypothetical protein